MDPSSHFKTVLPSSCAVEERKVNRYSSESGINSPDSPPEDVIDDSCQVDSSNTDWDEGSFVSLRGVTLGEIAVEPQNLRLDKPDPWAPGTTKRRMKKERALSDAEFEIFDASDHSEEKIDSREVALLNRITRRQGIPKPEPEFAPRSSEPALPCVSSIETSPQKIKGPPSPTRSMNRRRQIDPTTCERDYSREEIEFMRAMDNYKRTSGRMFPTCSEILEVVRSLGYVKVQNSQY